MYKLTQPILKVGDEKYFFDNLKRRYHGTCVMVATHYNSKHEAYHIYTMRVDGHKRDKHVGEEHLIAP